MLKLFTNMLRARFDKGRLLRHCLLLLGSVLMLSDAAFAQTAQNARDADRGSQYYVNAAAANAATEKVLAQMTADFLTGGESLVDANLGYYSGLVPVASDNAYWTNFTFLNPQPGATSNILINPPYMNAHSVVTLATGEFAGMNAIESAYSISSFARQTNNPNTNLIGGAEQDVALVSIPLFQFAIFYNGLLEFTTAGALAIQGPVHANSNIYVGSANPLTFNGTVTTTGVVTNPAWAGDTQVNYTGAVTYNGTPAPGVFAGQPPINLSFGTNSTAPTNMIQILYPPKVSDDIAMTQQRYWNKAEMLVIVSNTTYVPTNTLVMIKLQAPPLNGMSYQDISPMWFTNIDPVTKVTNSAWTKNNFDYWLSTTNRFYDFRQQQYMRVTQINVSNFNTWCNTNRLHLQHCQQWQQ